MNGILLIDKPAGPTSHDVVARLRRTTRQRSIGHAGTLDPAATGLLVLLLGKATRLSNLLTGHDKTYDATIRFGWRTTTDDADGEITGVRHEGPLPSDDAIATALDQMRGDFDQMPPRFSAKRVDGTQAYRLARKDAPMELKPSRVTLHRWEWLTRSEDTVTVRVSTSAGFYVRSLARDLGEALGCGAHLSALRRLQSGHFTVEDAIPLDATEEAGLDLSARLIPMADALPDLPAVRLSDMGLIRVRHGNPIGPQFVDGQWVTPNQATSTVRLLGPDGSLVALAELRGGALHPSVVLVYN